MYLNRSVLAFLGFSMAFSCLDPSFVFAQGALTPYGIDHEIIGCNSWAGGNCEPLDYSVTGNTQWVRLFVPWQQLEPNPPNGTPNPNVNGQMSGQHSYNWAYTDQYVLPAISRGLNVYLQIEWVPAWANGNPYPSCNPVDAGGSQGCIVNGQNVGNPQGYVPTNTAFLQDFAFNLAQHYNNEVYYYGPLNEPNGKNNYNPYDQGLPNASGEYLNYYINYYERPVSAGIKAANPQNQLVGPDVSLTASGPENGNGISNWLSPLYEYFSIEFDVWSVHSYHTAGSHNDVKSDMDNAGSATGNAKPMWLTETTFSASNLNTQYSNVSNLFIDQYNRSGWWTKIFYHDLANDGVGLLDGNYNLRPAFTAFQGSYGHQIPPTLTSTPVNTYGAGYGTGTITWNAPGHCPSGYYCQVWVGQPGTGTLFAQGTSYGSGPAGFLQNGMTLTLYDQYTNQVIATLVIQTNN